MGETLIPGLGEALGRAAERLHRRRQRRMRAAAASVVALLVIGVVAVTSTVDAPPAAAGVEIEVRDGRIVVRLTDLESRADVVEDALLDAGIDAEVSALPSGPSNLGRFVGFAGEDVEQVELLQGNGYTYGAFAVPTSYDGHLVVTIARLAEPGERYDQGTNALAPGEPLACLDVIGATARELAAVADDREDLNITADAYPVGGPIERRIPAAALREGPYADWIVVQVSATAPDAVYAILSVDGQSPIAGPPPPPLTGCG